MGPSIIYSGQVGGGGGGGSFVPWRGVILFSISEVITMGIGRGFQLFKGSIIEGSTVGRFSPTPSYGPTHPLLYCSHPKHEVIGY